MAAADALRMEADYILAGSRTADSMPDPLRKPRWSWLRSLQIAGTKIRALGENDARGAREVPQDMRSAGAARSAKRRNERAGLMAPRSALLPGESETQMPEEVSTLRLYLMRSLYLLNFAGLGLSVWPGLIQHQERGTRCKPLPSAFGQHCRFDGLDSISAQDAAFASSATVYKSVWLIAVALPAVVAGDRRTYQPFVIGLYWS